MIGGTISRLRMSCGYEMKPVAADLGGRSCLNSAGVSTVSVVSKTFSLLGCNETNFVVVFLCCVQHWNKSPRGVIPQA